MLPSPGRRPRQKPRSGWRRAGTQPGAVAVALAMRPLRPLKAVSFGKGHSAHRRPLAPAPQRRMDRATESVSAACDVVQLAHPRARSNIGSASPKCAAWRAGQNPGECHALSWSSFVLKWSSPRRAEGPPRMLHNKRRRTQHPKRSASPQVWSAASGRMWAASGRARSNTRTKSWAELCTRAWPNSDKLLCRIRPHPAQTPRFWRNDQLVGYTGLPSRAFKRLCSGELRTAELRANKRRRRPVCDVSNVGSATYPMWGAR